MAFVKKTWTDRIAEYINRRRLDHEDGSSELVTVAREEGTVSQEGDAFSAENMNDLEQRVADEFGQINEDLTQLNSKLEWKLVGTTDGTATLNIDTEKFKEIRAYTVAGGDLSAYRCTGTFPTENLSTSVSYIGLGGDNYRVAATKMYVSLSVFIFNTTNYTKDSKTYWYAR